MARFLFASFCLIHIIFFTVLFEYFMWRRSRRTFFSAAKFPRLGQTMFLYEPHFPGPFSREYLFLRPKTKTRRFGEFNKAKLHPRNSPSEKSRRAKATCHDLSTLSFRWKSHLKVFGFSMEILFSYIFRCPGRAPAFQSIHLIFGYGKLFPYVGNILNITTPLRDALARISV